MFERYTEDARRIIFFARHEAAELGSRSIEPEHMLLGLLRAESSIEKAYFPAGTTIQSIRNRIEAVAARKAKISSSVELPLSKESSTILIKAAEASEQLKYKHIDTIHIFLGILKTPNTLAVNILGEFKITLSDVLQKIQQEKTRTAVPTQEIPAAPVAATKPAIAGLLTTPSGSET